MATFGQSFSPFGQSRHPLFRTHQRQQPKTRRHEGFSSLREFLHPKLRPVIHINTVGRLIHFKFKRLEKMIDIVLQRGECRVYFPWSSTGWGFSIFQPAQEVKQLINQLALQVERKFAGQPVTFIKNIWDPSNPETDYSFLVEHYKNILLVFGDNTTGRGKGGTAAVRDHNNAFGIPTGWSDNFGVWTQEMEDEYAANNHLDYILERQEAVKERRVQEFASELAERELTLEAENILFEDRLDAVSAREEAAKQLEKELEALASELKERDLELRKKETSLSHKEASHERRQSKVNK